MADSLALVALSLPPALKPEDVPNAVQQFVRGRGTGVTKQKLIARTGLATSSGRRRQGRAPHQLTLF
jgi:hypothetical protein